MSFYQLMRCAAGTCVDMDATSRAVRFNAIHHELKRESIIIIESDGDSARRLVSARVSGVLAHVGLKNFLTDLTAKDAWWKSRKLVSENLLSKRLDQ